MLAQSPVRSPSTIAPARRSVVEIYRHHRLVAGQKADGFSAVSYAGKILTFSSSGSVAHEALDDLRAQIDSEFARLASQRRDGLPTADELALALALVGPKIPQSMQHLLEIMDEFGEVHVQQLLRRAGTNEEALLRDLVRLARACAKALDIRLAKGATNASAAVELIAGHIELAEPLPDVWLFRTVFAQAGARHLAR